MLLIFSFTLVNAQTSVDLSDPLSFPEINEGDFYGILGPNGAGKTTIINIITGLVFRDNGSTLVFGKDTVTDFRFTNN